MSSVPEPTPRLGAGPDRLDSWKEIASYLKREVRTVQMWEKKEGLPIHRHFHNHLGTVFAFRSEIEAWGLKQATKHQQRASVASETSGPSTKPSIRIAIASLHPSQDNPDDRALCMTILSETIAALDLLDSSNVQVLGLDLSQQTSETLDYRLEWEIWNDHDHLTLKASLLELKSQLIVWSRNFHLTPEAGGEISTHIADQIARYLWLKTISSLRPSLSIRRVEAMSSREAYLKGRYFLSQRNEEGMRKAAGWFRAAIKEDPDFALPYSGLADSLTLLSFYEIESPSITMPAARCAALKALELAPNVAEAHASLADIRLHFDRDWDGADQEYRQAIQCNPEYALGYHWYANLLSARGQHEAACVAIMNALEIDPVSLITQVWAGVTQYLAHRFDEAIAHYQSALELDPHYIWAHMYMAQALEQKGRYHEAIREFDTTIQLAGGSSCVTAMKAHALAAAGETSAARVILRRLRNLPNLKCMPSYDIAATYAALGESSQMAVWLMRACEERNMKLFKLRRDPRFDNARHSIQFQQVVQHIGLSRYDGFEIN